MPINETDLAAQIARAHLVADLWQDNPDVLPEKVVDNHKEDEPHNDGINKEEAMPENESTNESGSSDSTHDDKCVA